MATLIKPTKDTAMEYLHEVAASLSHPCEALCLHVLTDTNFEIAPGGSSHHHNYLGGLAEHTAEVVHNCIILMGELPHIDRDLLLTAAIWHDYCKTLDYELVTEMNAGEDIKQYVKKLPYLYLVGHVTGSVLAMKEVVSQLRCGGVALSHAFEYDLTHVMLAHHGQRDWGSPVVPKTFEAWMLHAADMLSAQPLCKA